MIVMGLYLVIWGKTEDESGLAYPEPEIISQQQQQLPEIHASGSEHVTKPISGDNVV